MKALRNFTLAVLCLLATRSSAQQFLNGSMEPVAPIATCADIPKTAFNANMGNVWESSEITNIYVANGTCGLGAAADGNTFVVLKYRIPLGNLLNFRLDAPLIIGQAYKVAFKYKTIAGAGPLGGARFGYAKDSASFDSTVGHISGMVNTAWAPDTFTFTPQKAWKYMWIEVLTLQGQPYDLHLDDFRMFKVGSSAGVPRVAAADAIRVFPNPFHTQATLRVDAGVQLPCRMQVFDITGKQLLQRDLHDREYIIDKAGLASGMYFIKLTDQNQAVYTGRLMAD